MRARWSFVPIRALSATRWRGGARVAFEVDAVDEGSRTGWSVVVRGQAAEVLEPADLGRLHRLPLFPWAPGAKARYVRIRPVSITAGASPYRPTCRSPGGADGPDPGDASTAMTATPPAPRGGRAPLCT